MPPRPEANRLSGLLPRTFPGPHGRSSSGHPTSGEPVSPAGLTAPRRKIVLSSFPSIAIPSGILREFEHFTKRPLAGGEARDVIEEYREAFTACLDAIHQLN